ncbi:glycine betaine/proline transport system substrate-binding protein [Pseudomonas chlororaphis]|uniref:ABC transporter substrate-binding protein n=1 Tax=Pseudomonas chlororaphis TaxID=587753 RepID=UPI00087B3D00|nr:ABC transporter substrate-binding protein [Pseudomonas chlororaphis]AZD66375.1 putative periplasmic substrate-binding protein [Pseudomonas chlororaphis subsp. aurantiaca]QIT22451.1 ABC transporter substrate-binding protein [Pseudomonas chlororaphis subsp. aurantiaca]WDH06614.1 ABC transporter substrate-binding protein [Pseudomonas chlororaphis]WDH10632.1 ABC transporter substrate-binding protein [Pseudomonas chlororaphis]SDT33507.1 glycine betaine/proline transport system substrate-binding 
MKGLRTLLGGALLGLGILLAPAGAWAAPAPIHFADLNWESGSLITDILRTIVEKGYDLPTDTLPGTTITLETALANNDIQVIGEEWAGRSPVWVKAEAEGKVAALGDTVKGATEGWWVPEYVVKGDPAKGIKPLAPGLRSVTDLARYKDVFKDPESPGKGRFLNSPIGWTSEVVNKQKLKAYGLTDSYVNFRSGSGAALDAEITSSIRRGQPVLFYYWSPTPLLGRFKLIQLEEPPFDAEAWKTLTDPEHPNPRPTRSLASKLSIGVSTPFQKQYPQIAEFFSKVDLPIEPLNKALAEMSEKHTPPREAARAFLKAHPQVWRAWLPEDVADKVSASLD